MRQRNVAKTKKAQKAARHSNKHSATCFGNGHASGIKMKIMGLEHAYLKQTTVHSTLHIATLAGAHGLGRACAANIVAV